MSKAWRHLDLGGGGLQAANIRLASKLKKRRVAYGLLALFPLGLHRRYLGERRGPWIYVAASALTAGLAGLGYSVAALAAAALIVSAVVFDAFWIDRRITRVNKEIRREVFMGHGLTPPAGYRGRPAQASLDDYLEAKAAEPVAPLSSPRQPPAASTQPPMPSLAEQERLLAEIARAKARRGPE